MGYWPRRSGPGIEGAKKTLQLLGERLDRWRKRSGKTKLSGLGILFGSGAAIFGKMGLFEMVVVRCRRKSVPVLAESLAQFFF